MITIKVVALFDDLSALAHARDELVRDHLAADECIRAEAASPEIAGDAEASSSWWERLKEFFETESNTDDEHDFGTYAEGVRRGGALLVVETSDEKAEAIKDVLRRAGAVDLRRRVLRWISAGWQSFNPASPLFTELEIVDERRASVSEADIAADAAAGSRPDQTVALFVEPTGEMLGHISEQELEVLQHALEEENPEDDDYWINRDEIDSIAGRPGATPHLIALLRRAVGASADGADIRFERAGDSRPR